MSAASQSWPEWLDQSRAQRHSRGLQRRRTVIEAVDGVRARFEGDWYLNFSSNDYLGLAATGYAQPCSAQGSGASALITGYRAEHHQLEQALATFFGREAALLLPSGYHANLAVLCALVGRDDHVIQDRLCHASLIDGARLSGARLLRYPHGDLQGLQRQLDRPCRGRRLVVTEGIFSMDGDLAPMPEMAELCGRAGAWLMVDDAHGVGIHGPSGRGSVAAAGLDHQEVPVLVGTLGKAFGTAGAFVAGSAALVEHIVNHGRSYIYTTAQPPSLARASLDALKRVADGDDLRDRLQHNIRYFRDGARRLRLSVKDSSTPIQPLMAGEPDRAVCWGAVLREAGILVTPIRPPTVPAGSARLRITLSAAHEATHIDALLDALAGLA